MEDILSVLLVEDEPGECRNIIDCIESLDDVRLICAENNAFKALEHVQDSLPDAVILDLELHKGGGNGLTFLNSLREMKLPVQPYVLVTTNNVSYITHESARRMGADFIMLKSQEDYSAQNVIGFLRSLKQMIHNARRACAQSGAADESAERRKQRIKTRVVAELDRIGISPKVIGRKYLIDGILLIIDGRHTGVYSAIGEKYGKSDASVERAMQNAINKAWRTTDIDDLQKYYTIRISSSKNVPTITEFIYYYAERIKNKDN